jgi:hypothetical protein
MTYTISLRVERGDENLELYITGSVSPFYPGILHRLPEDSCEPEGGDVTIESITLNDKPWEGELTDYELGQVDDKLFELYLYDSFDPDDDLDINPFHM